MLKQELIAAVAEKFDVNLLEARKIVEGFGEVIFDALNTEEVVVLPGVGRFKVRDIPERYVRNPKSSETVFVGACKKVKFSIDGALKSALRG